MLHCIKLWNCFIAHGAFMIYDQFMYIYFDSTDVFELLIEVQVC